MKKTQKRKSAAGRPKLGHPVSVVLTDEQRAWLEARIPPGGTLARAVRDAIDLARRNDTI